MNYKVSRSFVKPITYIASVKETNKNIEEARAFYFPPKKSEVIYSDTF